jgi:hypothetical protein
MNKRIKELEKQADAFVLSIPASLDINEYTSIFNEKFAELIIEECAIRSEVYAYMSPNFNALAEELRRMKESQE